MFDLYIPVPQRRDVLRRFVLLVMVTLLLVAAAPAAAFAQDTLVTQGAATTEDVALAIDTTFVFLAALLVLFMQAGFAMLEVGFSRMKNVGSVVAKILAMMGIGIVAFWVAGFAFTFSDGGGLQSLIGTQGFFLSGDEATYAGLGWTAVPVSAKFLFQVAFALVSLAIVWGTMLERTKFAVYCIFAVVFAGLIYPIIGHWIWGGGWLSEFGMQDFAGSTVVHLSGAIAAPGGPPPPRPPRRQGERAR